MEASLALVHFGGDRNSPNLSFALNQQYYQPRQLKSPSRSRHCAKVQASGKKGIGTYPYEQNDVALEDLQPETTWFYTWSASKDNVAGSGQVLDICNGFLASKFMQRTFRRK